MGQHEERTWKWGSGTPSVGGAAAVAAASQALLQRKTHTPKDQRHVDVRRDQSENETGQGGMEGTNRPLGSAKWVMEGGECERATGQNLRKNIIKKKQN